MHVAVFIETMLGLCIGHGRILGVEMRLCALAKYKSEVEFKTHVGQGGKTMEMRF